MGFIHIKLLSAPCKSQEQSFQNVSISTGLTIREFISETCRELAYRPGDYALYLRQRETLQILEPDAQLGQLGLSDGMTLVFQQRIVQPQLGDKLLEKPIRLQHAASGISYELARLPALVGRSEPNNIQMMQALAVDLRLLVGDDRRISRVHLKIKANRNELWLESLRENNPATLDGTIVSARSPERLYTGACIGVGPVNMILQM